MLTHVTIVMIAALALTAGHYLCRWCTEWAWETADCPVIREIEEKPDNGQRFDKAATDAWIERAKIEAASLAATSPNGCISADDLWVLCPPPENVDGRRLSEVWTKKDWERVGWTHSARGHNKGRQIAIWRWRHATASEAA